MLERKDWRPFLWAIVGLMAVAVVVSLVGWNSWGWGHDGYGMMGGWMWMPVLLVMMFFMMSMGGHGRGAHGHGGHAHDGDAQSVLDRRYAAGEISREKYQRIRDDLDRRT